jgi:hypothetical protein
MTVASNKKLIEPVPGLIVDGKQYYRFVNHADIPEARIAHFRNFQRELQYGADEKLIIEYLKEIRTATREGRTDDVESLTLMLEDTIKNCKPTEAYYRIAALVFFTDGEDLNCYDYDFNDRKIEAFKQHPNQAFFLTLVLRHYYGSASLSQADIEDYLTKTKLKLKLYARILSDMKEPKPKSDSTQTS